MASSSSSSSTSGGLPAKNVSVVGIGRLGLCFALVLESKGYHVVGVDISAPYVAHINKKTLRSNEPMVETMLAAAKNLRATTALADAVAHSDTIFILVDTPSTGGERHYDHSKLGSVLLGLNALRVENKHIVIGCTVLPGYISGVGRYLIKDCVNCSLSYNPEFIAQGDIINGQLRPDMVLIGEGSKQAGDRMQKIYEDMCENKPKICRMSPESAEICKLGVNCFITMKVTFSNLIGDIADRTPGADKFAITSAIGQDSRIGTKYLRPGYGYGGPCFPRDNRALGGFAEMVGIDPLLFKATDEYNKYHTKVQLADKLAEPVDSFTFTGVAYKPNTKVPIVEESQRLAIARGLAEAGRQVTIRDYADTVNEVKKEFGGLFNYEVLRDDQSNAPEPEPPRTTAPQHPRKEHKVELSSSSSSAPRYTPLPPTPVTPTPTTTTLTATTTSSLPPSLSSSPPQSQPQQQTPPLTSQPSPVPAPAPTTATTTTTGGATTAPSVQGQGQGGSGPNGELTEAEKNARRAARAKLKAEQAASGATDGAQSADQGGCVVS